MKRVTLALATLLLALAVIPTADARVVQPPWVVGRWSLLGDCKIWRNDISRPWGPGGQPVAFATSYPEADVKLQGLIARRWCRSAPQLDIENGFARLRRAKFFESAKSLVIQEAAQLAAAARVLELAQRLGLDLADALARH